MCKRKILSVLLAAGLFLQLSPACVGTAFAAPDVGGAELWTSENGESETTLKVLNPLSFSDQALIGAANDGVDFNELVGLGNGVYFGVYNHVSAISGSYGDAGKASSYSETATSHEGVTRPVLWRLTGEENGDGMLTLASEYILDNRQFHSDTKNLSSDYTKSDIRKWLNGEFLSSAFSKSESAAITPTNVVSNISRSTVSEANSGIQKTEEVIAYDDKVYLPWRGTASAYTQGIFPAVKESAADSYGSMGNGRLRNDEIRKPWDVIAGEDGFTMSVSNYDQALFYHGRGANTYNHTETGCYTTSYFGVRPVIKLIPASILFVSEISSERRADKTPSGSGKSEAYLAGDYEEQLNYNNWADEVRKFKSEMLTKYGDQAPDYIEQLEMLSPIFTPPVQKHLKNFKLTVANPVVKLTALSQNGAALKNGAPLQIVPDEEITLFGTASGHDKLVYKIVRSIDGKRTIVAYGAGTAQQISVSARDLDGRTLETGNDYALYVWAQKDNTINSNEASAPLCFALGVGTTAVPVALAAPFSTSLAVAPSVSTVSVNGKNIAFDAYSINDNNYFKLRDLAYALNGTEKQFEVSYDEATKAIALASGEAYTPVGGEMTGKGAGNKTATPTTSKTLLDGKTENFTAYNIDGSNYFKLRDIGQAFDFDVTWDGVKKTISIDTSKGYTPE